MPDRKDFQAVFNRLQSILRKLESRLVVAADAPGNYYLNTPFSEKYKKELFFGAVQVKKNYVSYHLMPVYMFPGLLKGASAGLRKRMQGKSCFNFTRIDEELFSELAALTRKGFEKLRQEKVF